MAVGLKLIDLFSNDGKILTKLVTISKIFLKHRLQNTYHLFMSVISTTPGGILDRAIEAEDKRHGDFMRLVLASSFLYYLHFTCLCNHL